ncbi:hypothetical protein BGZ46_004835 [Entomortierella lignicola]|nr:hypothetical protein BGZ46_004835 [Entomortierella lignicola]
MKELNFHPTSLTAACGYLAAGGQRSQLMVRQMNSDWVAHTSVGGTINNALCISEHLGGTRLLISNNDETIKVYSLPRLERITSIQLPTAVNYASVSPDGRKMVAVGDTNQVFLYDISVAGGYQKIGTYTAATEASFSCAWNQSSEKFAVASQDGFVSVWDIRHSEKICKLGSKQQPQTKGATRCVKFSSSGSIDLLMFSEHVSYINLVDARTFNDRQVVRVASPNNDEHISGIAISPDSKVCFVGMEHSVLDRISGFGDLAGVDSLGNLADIDGFGGFGGFGNVAGVDGCGGLDDTDSAASISGWLTIRQANLKGAHRS